MKMRSYYFHRLILLTVLVILAIVLLPLSVEPICANLGNVRLSKIYQGSHENLAPKDVQHFCLRLLTLQDTTVPWQIGMLAYLNGELPLAEEYLDAALARLDERERTLRQDQLLIFAQVAPYTEIADFAVAFAQRHSHQSPIGYLRLARHYISQTRAGNTTNWERAKVVARLAGETNLTGRTAIRRRAEAWFYLGDLWYGGDGEQAILAYRAVLEEDPTDDSGYSWASAMKLEQIYARQEEWRAAREMLTYAETLPDRYHRYSHTRMRLAKREVEQGKLEQAITVLEETITRDPVFIPTRLYLASLYLSANQPLAAKAQYEAVLDLDPNQAEAQEGLASLERQ